MDKIGEIRNTECKEKMHDLIRKHFRRKIPFAEKKAKLTDDGITK